MSISDGQYLAWLAKTNVDRLLLAELHHAGGVEYVATGPFMSLPSDADPNRPYIACIKKAVDITTRTDGNTTFGEITLTGDQLAADWHSFKWHGHPIKLYLGAPDWARDDFRLLAQGRNGGPQEARRGALTLRMDDESSVLDEVIDTGQLPNDAGPVPLALGSVYNAPLTRIDTQTLTYRGSYLPVTSIAAKANGAMLTHSTDTAAGTVTLNAQYGDITGDIEEPHNTPQKIVEWVAAHYGITIGDIDLPPYRVGLFYTGEVTGRQILNAVKEGLGAYWYLNELNELVMRQHKAPTTADVTIVRDDIFYGKLVLSDTEQPWRSLTLRWGRNYSPLSNVAASLDEDSPAEATRLRTEWRESYASQDVSDYPMAERITRDSIIQDEADAITERNRLLSLRSVQRNTWSIEARFPPVFAGQVAAVDHGRLQGKLGRLINVSRSPTKAVTSLGLWV
ncbi:hypothetical protein [Halomonas campaniensis]|uniref:Tip attachment protein J domain-containing protein n=1 Tax=Halomonas campaniensis TaxID=213554 RepID=A0A246RZ89_9GAMM|nr:hypothetical protein [Halomonas campaniensis]OWV29441.1 hypothetical protein JI62_11535 [Halomonas campaniensis]